MDEYTYVGVHMYAKFPTKFMIFSYVKVCCYFIVPDAPSCVKFSCPSVHSYVYYVYTMYNRYNV